MRNKKLALPVLLGAMAAAACATSGSKKASVDNSYIARLPQASLAQVDEARMDVMQAGDEVTRAENMVTDAKNSLDAAKAETKVVEQQQKAAEARLEASQERNDIPAAEIAQQELSDLDRKEQVAQAQIDAANSRVELARKELDLAQKEQDLSQAELERTKYQALVAANSPDAKEYDASEFDQVVQNNQNQVADAQRQVQAQRAAYMQKRMAWREAEQRYQAGARPPPG
jgi:chromosome segregation ATPase